MSDPGLELIVLSMKGGDAKSVCNESLRLVEANRKHLAGDALIRLLSLGVQNFVGHRCHGDAEASIARELYRTSPRPIHASFLAQVLELRGEVEEAIRIWEQVAGASSDGDYSAEAIAGLRAFALARLHLLRSG